MSPGTSPPPAQDTGCADVTISFTRYSESDEMVLGCLREIAGQVGIRGRVLFLDQRRDARLDEALADLSTPALVFERRVIPARGIAHARNLAIEACRTELLMFVEPDIRPDPDWAAELMRGLTEGAAAAVTGRVLPHWLGPRPLLARSRSVLEMYSILNRGEETSESRKLMGGCLGLNLRLLGGEARFDETLGRLPGRLASGEEQELADRLLARGSRVLYCGRAVTRHLISRERCRASWLVRRVVAAGFDRGSRGQRPRPSHRMKLLDRILTLPLALPYGWGVLKGVAARRGR